MLSKPFLGMRKSDISQTFHSSHKGLDIYNPRYRVLGYGTPLCAPERVRILSLKKDEYTPNSTANLKRGYGVFMTGLETGLTHLYWHTLPFLPVSVGEVIERGKIVAFMGNAGYVTMGGEYVPLEERTNNPHAGTHLHQELYDTTYKLGAVKPFLNPLDYYDWTREPTYTTTELLGAWGRTLQKMLTATHNV